MRVLDFDFDLEAGAAWITVEGRNNEEQFIVQCCTEQTNDNERVIDIRDWQIDRGLNECINDMAFKHWGGNQCANALIYYAKRNGFLVKGA